LVREPHGCGSGTTDGDHVGGFRETGPLRASAADASFVSLERLLSRQAGVVTLAQALSCGMSADTVRRRVRTGRWHELYPCVFLVGGHRLSDEARVRAAWLWSGGTKAAVTGPAAAFWHGMLDRAPIPVEVTVLSRSHRRRRPGAVLRRRALLPADLVTVRGLRMADKPFAALETARALAEGSVFLDRVLQRHVRFPALYRSYTRNLGRVGWAEVGRLIRAAADRADSAAERLLVRLLRDAGIGGWVLGYPFGPYRLDLAFPAARLAVEVDGWAWHVDPERFRNDRRKGNAVTGAGWGLLRFTWHALNAEPARCVAEVSHMIDTADARPA
jgi:very-short-patch-repair endonuclease